MSRHPLLDRIVADPRVCAGRPVVKGTRIWVTHVLALLGEGRSHEHIIAHYPPLTEDDIRACLLYGALMTAWEEVEPPSGMKKSA